MTKEERLHLLERDVLVLKRRNLLFLVVFSFVLVCCFLIIACNEESSFSDKEKIITFRKVRAKAFELIDGNDSTRAMLGSNKSGTMFFLVDEKGVERIRIGFEGDETGIRIYDESHIPRIALKLNDKDPGLILSDVNGKPNAWFAIDDEIGANMFLCNGEGHKSVLLGTSQIGPVIKLSDAIGTDRVECNVYRGSPSILVYDKDGNCRTEIGTGGTETPDGRIIIHPEASLRLYKPNGKVLWSAP